METAKATYDSNVAAQDAPGLRCAAEIVSAPTAEQDVVRKHSSPRREAQSSKIRPPFTRR